MHEMCMSCPCASRRARDAQEMIDSRTSAIWHLQRCGSPVALGLGSHFFTLWEASVAPPTPMPLNRSSRLLS